MTSSNNTNREWFTGNLEECIDYLERNLRYVDWRDDDSKEFCLALVKAWKKYKKLSEKQEYWLWTFWKSSKDNSPEAEHGGYRKEG